MNKNAKVITFKVNKGGVGKTFLTAQIGHSLALLGKKVLIITSDSQNNILNFLYKDNREFKKGLKSEIRKEGSGDRFLLRKTPVGGELSFIPLEDSKFSSVFPTALKKWIEKVKKNYDFILIDSVPTMKIDSVFLEVSDKIIIPAYCDEVTIEGIVNLLKEVDLDKVYAICINRYSKTATQKKYLDLLKDAITDTDIIFPEPIPHLSFVEKMIDNKKTIWEYKNKTTEKIQEILVDLLQDLV